MLDTITAAHGERQCESKMRPLARHPLVKVAGIPFAPSWAPNHSYAHAICLLCLRSRVVVSGLVEVAGEKMLYQLCGSCSLLPLYQREAIAEWLLIEELREQANASGTFTGSGNGSPDYDCRRIGVTTP